MKKRTIAIVSISLVLAILAVAVIATFPTYIFEDEELPALNPDIQSDNVTQGDDVGVVGGESGGVEGILPNVSEDDDKAPSTNNTGLKNLASDDGAKLLAENGAFGKDAEYEVDKLGIFDKKYYRARHYVRDFAKNYTMYEITVQRDGKDVQPLAAAKVVIEIPENYNIDDVEVYYMLSNGGVQKLNCAIDKTARTATVSFMQSGVFILIERDKTADDNTSSNNSSTESDNSSSTPTDTSSDTSSDASGSTDSDVTDSSDTNSDVSSDSSSTESDPNKDTMDGWTPWY